MGKLVNWLKPFGLWFLIAFGSMSLVIFLTMSLAVFNEVLGPHLPYSTSLIISWGFCVWMLFIPIAGGATAGLELFRSSKESGK